MNDLFDLVKEPSKRNDGEIVVIKKLMPHLPEAEYKRYNLCFYKEIDFHANIEILYPVNIKITEIRAGYLGHYALHDGIIYNSILTNDLDNHYFKMMDEYSNDYEDAKIFGINQMEVEDEQNTKL